MKHMTDCENTWCPGCGNFGILTAINNAIDKLEEKGISKDTIVMTAGIGCHAKIFDYLGVSGFYGLHGRGVPLGEGIKLGNPKLKVIIFAGDGDAWGEGFAHTLFAAKRNVDVTLICHNNGVYALTTGQFTPLSVKGFKGKSTPKGSPEEPLNPLRMMKAAEASWIGRGYCGNIEHLTKMIVEAVMHDGFSYLDVLQVCKTYNNLYDVYNEKVEVMENVPDANDAVGLMEPHDKVPIGVFSVMERPLYRKEMGDRNPVADHVKKKEREEKIKGLL